MINRPPRHLAKRRNELSHGAAEGWINPKPTIWDGLNPVRAFRALARQWSGRAWLAGDAVFVLLYLYAAAKWDSVGVPLVLLSFAAFWLVLAALSGANRRRQGVPAYKATRDNARVVLGWTLLIIAVLLLPIALATA